MSVLTERVCRTIERHRLLTPGARVVVAASGGADSTALVCLLREIAPRFEVGLAGLAHFNHSLRGTASDEDERFCRDLAERFAVPFVADREDVRAAARRLRTSLEDAGRRLRYGFLERARERLSASHVAVGHTRDDQAETLLLNVFRGAGTRGLGGMPPVRGVFVRPLIGCSHRELVEWLDGQGIAYREDESNSDLGFARNRLRHEVMPAIERAFPGAGASLARSAELARSDADYLDALAEAALSGLARRVGGRLVIDSAAFRQVPRALALRVARLALLRGCDGRFVGVDHAERLIDLVSGETPGRLVLPGLQADLAGGELVLRARRGRLAAGAEISPSPSGNSFRAALSIPGEAPLGDGRVVSSELRPGRPSSAHLDCRVDASTAVADAGRFSCLAVRYRRPGDRFRPLGMNGHKKLQDFLVDRKVPRGERGGIPLVVDGEDRIVWVAGHAVSEDFRVSEATRAVVILKLRGERV
jgi:tRNA(Ile)-lysidine synthase